jgi:predicted metal-dependent hydrolase
MITRFPKFDFSRVRAHWAPDAEFAQKYNAASLVPAHVEPYLLKVMKLAQERLEPGTRLYKEADIFCKQEMQHMKQHIAFNRQLREQGYEGLKPIEDAYAADLDRYLKSKSLRFNLAYMEGFESISAAGCQAWFEDYVPYREGSDPEIDRLWSWHLAEEFEHRTVAFDVFHKASGLGHVTGYFYRLYGYFFALVHIGMFSRKAGAYLLGKDRDGMSEKELDESIAREKALGKVQLRGVLKMMRVIVSPFYDPAKRPAPRGQSDFLDAMTPARADEATA